MFKGIEGNCIDCGRFTWLPVKSCRCAKCNYEFKKKNKGLSVKPTPIKKVSDKRKAKDIAYSVLRVQYLKDHPHCQSMIRGVCKGISEDIHHLYSGTDRLKYMNDFGQVIAICRSCHSYIHDVMSAKEARELGFKK